MMRPLLLACVALLLAGCETLAYYGKGVAGQWRFYGAREPIAKVLQRDDLAPETRRRLELVGEIRRFARDELALPVKGQYRDYVQLQTSSVAWSVFAAPELSLEPYRWCYLFRTLCVEYRGYFREADAQAYAEKLRARGYETHIGEVAAFSSLGLLDDPVTSVLAAYPDDLLALVLFHELAHSVLYVKDDTAFNESFAEAVGEEGLRRWRAARGAAGESPVVARYRAQQALLVDVALATRTRLASLYAQPLAVDAKRVRKGEILAAAGAEYLARCAARPETAACTQRGWFDDGLNNARLNAVATYQHWVPAFTALMRAGEDPGKLKHFLRTAKALSRMPRRERDAVLRALMPATAEPAGATTP
ncbi:MAG: aminopeptidase [Pseudomonadota bacterium]